MIIRLHVLSLINILIDCLIDFRYGSVTEEQDWESSWVQEDQFSPHQPCPLYPLPQCQPPCPTQAALVTVSSQQQQCQPTIGPQQPVQPTATTTMATTPCPPPTTQSVLVLTSQPRLRLTRPWLSGPLQPPRQLLLGTTTPTLASSPAAPNSWPQEVRVKGEVSQEEVTILTSDTLPQPLKEQVIEHDQWEQLHSDLQPVNIYFKIDTRHSALQSSQKSTQFCYLCTYLWIMLKFLWILKCQKLKITVIKPYFVKN